MTLVFEYLANLIDAVASVWFVTSFSKVSIKSCKLFYPIILISFTVSNYFTHNTHFSEFHLIILIVLLFIYSFSIRNTKLLNKLISPILFYVVLIITNTLVLFLYPLLLPTTLSDIVHESVLHRYLYIFLCKVIMLTILLLINRIMTVAEHFSLFDFIMYLVSPFVTILTLYLFLVIGIDYDISKYTYLVVTVIIILSVINITTLVLFKKNIESKKAFYELELLNNRSKWEEQRYNELSDVYQKLQITRHDIKEHLNYIGYLIDNKKYDEASSYITSKTDELNNTKRVYHTNNRLIDYVIDSKISQNNDIEFTISGTLEKIDNIIDSDLFSLLGNMLNNAIEGANSTESKQIEIEFSVNGNYQNIVCKNSINGSVLSQNPEFKTSKKDKSKHGYGIKSMRRIVEKYDGLIDFYEENEKFCVHIALPIKTIEENS